MSPGSGTRKSHCGSLLTAVAFPKVRYPAKAGHPPTAKRKADAAGAARRQTGAKRKADAAGAAIKVVFLRKTKHRPKI